MKILIADDEKIVCENLAAILKCDSEFAFDGEEAVSKIKKSHYDAVLLDLEMPKIDGYEVLKQVRRLDPLLPVIFISGRGKSEKITESIARDKLNAFLEKPFTAREVLETLNRVLSWTAHASPRP